MGKEVMGRSMEGKVGKGYRRGGYKGEGKAVGGR